MKPTRTRSQGYYLQTAIFAVEDKLYSIPKETLRRQSDVFDGMFQVQAIQADEGHSDENPITLEGYKSADFDALLRVLIPEPLEPSPPSLSKDEWISILKLATIWQMDKVRETSIEQLSALQISPIEKISLAREHRIAGWLGKGIHDLVNNFRSYTLSEVSAQLGWETTARVLSIRDMLTSKLENALCLADLHCFICKLQMNAISGEGIPTCNRQTACAQGPPLILVRKETSGQRIPMLMNLVCGLKSCGLGQCSQDTFRCTACESCLGVFQMSGPSTLDDSMKVESAIQELFGEEIKALEGI